MRHETGQAGASDDSTGVVLQFPLINHAWGVAEVERINPYTFYELGKELKEVLSLRGAPARQCFWELMTAETSIEQLLDGKPIQVGLSRSSLVALKDHINAIITQHIFETGPDGKRVFKPGDEPVPPFRWDWYATLLQKFETIFSEEMREAAAYHVPRRGIFWTPVLVDTAEESFPPDIRRHLPDKTIADWRAAGRCLAFNLLTASGFHVARAVEGTMESYYQLFTGKPGATERGWDDYAKALEKVAAGNPTPCPSAKTLTEFRQMKDDYRNPLVHPRVVLSEADARMLFANGESLIMAMAQEIEEAKKGVQPTLLSPAPATPRLQGGKP